MRDLLAPFSLPHFQQETGFLSAVAAGEVLLSLIGAGTSGLCQMLLAPSLHSFCSSRICQSLSNIPLQTTLDYTQGGKKLQKISGILWIMCGITSCKICSRDFGGPGCPPVSCIIQRSLVSDDDDVQGSDACVSHHQAPSCPPLSLPRIVSPATKRVI